MSDSESYSAPNGLVVRVSRATLPSSPSNTIAPSTPMAASSKRLFMACTIA